MKPERITIDQAQPIVGIPLRNLYHLAATGQVPGAAKFGKRWTFDEAKLRSWVQKREADTCRNASRAEKRLKTATGGATRSRFYGGVSRSLGMSTDGAYERATQRLLGAASRRAGRN